MASNVDDDDKYEKARVQGLSTKRAVLENSVRFLSGLIATITFGYLVFILFYQVRLFYPNCGTVYDRECNDRGTCSKGVCECDILFSGPLCTETQIPGYDLPTNQECSGRGLANPFIGVVQECVNGWELDECRVFVQEKRRLLVENGFNPFLVDDIVNVPVCVCSEGAGLDCSEEPCALDENGILCSANSLKTVGPYQNYSRPLPVGGCQCTTPATLLQPEYYALFNDDGKRLLASTYSEFLNQRFCGTVFSAGLENKILFLSSPAQWKCFCQQGYFGEICNLGACATNPQNGEICYGKGNPEYGFKVVSDEQVPVCADASIYCGFDRSCSPMASETFPRFNDEFLCDAEITCPADRPVRCGNTKCVRIEEDTRIGQENGFISGTIDVTQFPRVVRDVKCTRFTVPRHITSCFSNATELGAVVRIENDQLYLNISQSISLDYGSPLLYFEMELLAPGTVMRVETFDGQFVESLEQDIDRDTPEVFTGAFQYTMESISEWIDERTTVGIKSNDVTQSTNDYWLYPIMNWNYSGDVTYNASYENIRLGDPYQFTTIDSRVFTQTFIETGDSSYGVLVKSSTADEYLLPSGEIVRTFTCLSKPGECAWYVDQNTTQLRTLDYSLYVCESDLVPVAQTTPCNATYLEYNSSLVLQNWWTEILVQSESSTFVQQVDVPFSLEIKNIEERGYGFTLSFDNISPDSLAVISNLALVTESNVTYPFHCDISAFYTNRSVLDARYFADSLRTVTNPVVDTFVTAKRFVEGGTRYIRGKIDAIDTNARTLTVQPAKEYNGDEFNAYYKNVRSISKLELNFGIDDTDSVIAPLFCPDGSRSRLDTDLALFETTCNCTQLQPLNETDCICNDGIFEFTCTSNATVTSCPALNQTVFEHELSKLINSANTDSDCKCTIIDNRSGSDLVFPGVLHGNRGVLFHYGNTNTIPYAIEATLDGCGDGGYDFLLTVTNPALTTFSYQIPYQIKRAQNCVFDILINYNQTFDFPITSISLNYTGVTGVIESANLRFNPNGFSINSVEFPSISTSMGDSNGTYWFSGFGSYNYVQYSYSKGYIISMASATFYTELMFGGSFVNTPIELHASNNENQWYLLGIFYTAGQMDYQEMRLANINATAFSSYRLVSRQPFAVENWELFTNQECNCGDIDITISLTTTNGLKTYQDWLDSINFQLENLDSGRECIAADSCFVKYGGVMVDVSRDGVCNDEKFISMEFNRQEEKTTNVTAVTNWKETFTTKRYSKISDGLFVVQFSNGSFYNDVELLDGYDDFLDYSITLEGKNVTYYYLNANGDVLSPPTNNLDLFYVNDTFLIQAKNFYYSVNGITGENIACESGYDATDCGPSNRRVQLMSGYYCDLNQTAAQIYNDVLNKSRIFTRRTYLLQNFTELVDPYTLYLQNVKLFRKEATPMLPDCRGQTRSDPSKTLFCKNGEFVKTPSDCQVEYNELGNGCVEQLDASPLENINGYRCTCAPGYAGDGCQYYFTRPAYPEELNIVPAAEEVTCGGPPPLTERPPILNLPQEIITPDILVEMNRRVTGNSAPKSNLDVDYHRILPSNAPFGKRIKVRRVLPSGAIIYSTCPFARKHEDGSYKLIPDDVSSRNLVTGEPTWKVYTLRNGNTATYPWRSITTYDDFPYRCPNGQCVPDRSYCEQSQKLFPICNGRGTCLADGSCDCDAGYKTFTVNPEYTRALKPYGDSTEWVLNWNWKHHALTQCTAIDCGGDANPCFIPYGCYTGTESVDFDDRLILCPNVQKCAPNLEDCISEVNLQERRVCSGNGILRVKDFTKQYYCACGTPISDQFELENVTQITQLRSNGYGGENCDRYYPENGNIVFSVYDFANDQPFTSDITGEILPGKYVGYDGNPIGADPDEIQEWEICCDRSLYPRLELCPIVPCNVNSEIVCRAADNCDNPLVYPCNNHGVARADGTCSCSKDVDAGFGYTHDFDEYSDLGCFKKVQCPISPINNRICNTINPCSEPGEWRYPFPRDEYLEQQNFTAGIGGRGEYTNITLLNALSIGERSFNDKLFSAATTIALDVVSAIEGVNGCVCNEDESSFRRPYLLRALNGTDLFDFQVDNGLVYELSLIRIFYSGAATVNFTNENGDYVCGTQPITLPSQTDADWREIDCGKTYQCVVMNSQIGYENSCALDPTSEVCINFKASTCAALPETQYWPLESPNQFPGCLRGDDPDGCTCCQVVSDSNNVDFTSIQVSVVGSGNIEDIRYYGIADMAAPVVEDMKLWLNHLANTDTDCRDERFFDQFLDADNSYYTPLDRPTFYKQDKLTREQAIARCEETGGYLAVTDNFQIQNDISTITRLCSQFSTEMDTCWVAAKDREQEKYTREDFFLNGCNVCHYSSRISSTPMEVFDSQIAIDQVATAPVINEIAGGVSESQEFNAPSCKITFEKSMHNAFYIMRTHIDLTPSDYGLGFDIGSRYSGALETWVSRPWDEIYMREGDGYILLENIIRFGGGFDNNQGIKYIEFPGPSVNGFDKVYSNNCGTVRLNYYRTGACRIDTFRDNRQNFNSESWLSPYYFEAGILRTYTMDTSLDGFDRQFLDEELTCIKVYASVDYSRVEIRSFTQMTDTGTYGENLVLGANDHDFVPGFIKITRREYVSPIVGGSFRSGTDILDGFTPVYFKGSMLSFSGLQTNQYSVLPITRCDLCIRDINGNFAWDDKIYRQVSFFDEYQSNINPRLHLYLNNRYLALEDIPSAHRSFLDYFMHQVTYLNTTNTQFIDWELDACVIANEDTYALSICTDTIQRNYVCQYDYTKNMVQSGTSCSSCGTGSRVSGQPAPGTTCVDDFPLSVRENFPLQHEIKDAYLNGYLNIYIDSFNLDKPDITFPNVSVIAGYAQAWELWKNDVSTRQKTLTVNQQPSLNWVDMSLTNNWGIDCGNGICASTRELCRSIPDANNPPMAEDDVPRILGAVDPSLAFTDRTCGRNIIVQEFGKDSKFGPRKDFRDLKIIEEDIDHVQIQALTSEGIEFYNPYKNPAKLVFDANTTYSVFVEYRIVCISCGNDVTVRPFVHTLGQTVTRSYLDPISLNVDGNLNSFIATVEDLDNGENAVINGVVIPEIVFQGIGFAFSGLGVSSLVSINNPIITTQQTRDICTNRTKPLWVEPKGQIASSAPNNTCVITDADLDAFPDKNIGECACDFSLGGESCAYSAVLGKICGGFGIKGRVPLTQIITNEDGSYIDDNGFNCKNMNLGNVIFSTLVSNTISEFAKVFVESAPINSDRQLFFQASNPMGNRVDRTNNELECTLETSNLVFFKNNDELKKAVEFIQTPFYFNMNSDFENIDNPLESIITVNSQSENLGTSIDCNLHADLCKASNFNNNMYTITGNDLTDGDLITTFTTGSTIDILMPDDIELIQTIYLWGASLAGNRIDCSYDTGGCLLDSTTSDYQIYTCRCPSRSISLSSGTYNELQAFDSRDSTRVSIYPY